MGIVGVVWALIVVFGVSAADGLNIWPMPKWVNNGNRTLFMSPDFELLLLNNYGDDSSTILTQGFNRMRDAVTLGHVLRSNFSSPLLLKGIQVSVSSSDLQLQYGTDESYNLSIPSPDNHNYALLQAKTVYGALHGMQTFSQLCHFESRSRVIAIGLTPWSIIDEPRFSYRGLLIDTARHYQPMPMIKKVIDAMAYAKLNVLHWHISDTQSFPLEIPSYPKLWDGAYSVSERYTFADAADIVSYARMRGINVVAEIDVPGHALSWGVGYPSLWPSKDCQQPLDVSNEFTFKVIDGILSDFSKIFNFKFVHLGGDEVNTSCWSSTPRIKKWLKAHKINESQAYEYFVLRAQKIALSHGYEIINWEETFNNFGDKLDRKTVVHNWLDTSVPERVVASGLRCIVSNQDKWYLDHLDITWQEFYTNEPLTNITNSKKSLIIGGEVCMWGETVDASDIEQTIWPRAAAAAERLWTPYDKVAKDPKDVIGRLAHFRCLLNQRGVAAAPLAGIGRGTPIDPGSCYKQ